MNIWLNGKDGPQSKHLKILYALGKINDAIFFFKFILSFSITTILFF